MAKKTKECAELTRLQLIDAARAVFLEHGVSKTTMEQIAAKAGFTRGAIYWHFKNKVEIFVAMKDKVSKPLIIQLDEFLEEHPGTDQLEGIGGSIKAFLSSITQDQEIRETFLIMKRLCEYTDEFKALEAEIRKPEMDCMHKMQKAFERAKQDGLLKTSISPQIATEITQSFIVGLMHRWLDDQCDFRLMSNPDDAIDSLISLLRV